MEENTNPEPQQEQKQEEVQEKPSFQQGSNGVSFPSVNQQPKSRGPKTILIAGILILVAILGFVVYKSATKNAGMSTEPTPFDNMTTSSEDTMTPSTPSATTAPKAADKSGVSISVQNGTGIAGEAAYLQTQLKNLGYTDVTAGNASSQDATTTTVVFSKDLADSIVTEITQELNSLYQKVTTSTSSSATTDIVVTTGLRKGATAKPSAVPTTAATASPSPSTSPTATP